jgi:hypothetical protein
VSRSPREDIGMRRPGEGAPGDGLHRPDVDEAECDNPPRKIPYYRLRPIPFGH